MLSRVQVVHAVILLALVDAGVVLYIDVGHRNVRFSKALLNVGGPAAASQLPPGNVQNAIVQKSL